MTTIKNFVVNNSDTPNIAFRAVFLSFEELGSHVERRSESGARELAVVHHFFSEPEIGNF